VNVDKDGLVHDALPVDFVDGQAYIMVNDLMRTPLTVTIMGFDGVASLFNGSLYRLACKEDELLAAACGGRRIPLYAPHEVREVSADVDCMACIAEACR
jgi:hypothetical protein